MTTYDPIYLTEAEHSLLDHSEVSGVPQSGATAAAYRATAVKAESIPRNVTAISDVAALVSQRQSFQLLWLDAGTQVDALTFTAWATGATTPTNQWFSLYSLALAKLAVTADDTTTAWGPFVVKTLALSTPYTVTASGLYYVGCMVKAATCPTLIGAQQHGSFLSEVPIMHGYDGTNTALTDPASAPATAAALTAFASSAILAVQAR